MNQVKIRYNKNKSKPFTLEIENIHKLNLTTAQLKILQQDISNCFLEQKVDKEKANF